eukprot:gene25064-51269_t
MLDALAYHTDAEGTCFYVAFWRGVHYHAQLRRRGAAPAAFRGAARPGSPAGQGGTLGVFHPAGGRESAAALQRATFGGDPSLPPEGRARCLAALEAVIDDEDFEQASVHSSLGVAAVPPVVVALGAI